MYDGACTSAPWVHGADDGGLIAGSNMETETTPTETTTIEQPVTPPAEVKPQAKTFTQEELDRVVAKRLEEDRSRRAKETAKPSTPAPAVIAEKPISSMSATEVRTLMARDREFTRVTATASISDRQLERMEQAFNVANPENVSQWARDYLDDMGLAKQPAAPAQHSTVPSSPAAPAAPATPPVVAPSAPSGHGLPTQNGVVDLFNLTPQQLKDLTPAGVREQLEKLGQIQRQQSGIPERRKPPNQR